ncbi:type II CAAX endopeptidase family protein [Lactiplantibacillus sp. WILCCON 0030]|uniref:Type II CAAX endopeptidase family protein n=2 Tax=Lactiplantibacillus brownii TaxID=3069269 RepID=A0ABU1A893_9LACO|nr:type II CAAX endopeptidase family protein [Lactiplantibacillus brownii]MDQ7936560.1 type II CAAX endopeptidase family protein [Lactiplantibacillus brownii]
MANRRQSLSILVCYFIVYALPTLLVTGFPHLGSEVYLIQTLDYLIGAIIIGWLAWHHAQPNTIEQQPSTWLSTILWGLAGTFIVIVGQNAILNLTRLLGQSTASENTSTLLAVGQKYPFFFLAVLVGAPIMEEIVFRKVIFGFFTPVTGSIGAAVISSLLFSFAHADGHLILYAFVGLFFCWLYRHTGRIQTSMIAHVLMNGAVVIPILFN